ncbi:MAG: carbohydrate ABC transporter permease [Chloroflexota bacterium]
MAAAQSLRRPSAEYTTARLLKLGRRAIFYAAVLLLVVFYLFPTLYVLSTSLKLPVDYFTIPPHWIPSSLTLANYEKMFVDYQAGTALANSLFIATLNTVVTLIMSIPVAYAIARYKVGGGALGFWIISQRMLPAVAIVIPFFLTFRALNLINTYHGMIIAYALFFIPFAVWILLGFFEDFPQEIQDAALIDGCSELGTIVRIVIPILAGSIFVVALLLFVFTWNDLLIALVLTRAETRTMMVFFSATLVSPTQQDYGVAAGAVVVGMIPAYLFAVLGQRYLVRGLTMGGLKG